jgi:hypothetical protein
MENRNDIDATIPFIVLVLILILALSSCARNGYGCQGRSKIMTRVR